MWCTFADTTAIKYSIISRYFRLCHSLNGLNYAWSFPQVTATWKNVFPNISPGVLSVPAFLSVSACFARTCKMKLSGVVLMKQHCCVQGFTYLQASTGLGSTILHFITKCWFQNYPGVHSPFEIMTGFVNFKLNLFINSLLFSWNCAKQIATAYRIFCLLILHQNGFRLFKEPHFPE